MVDMHRRAVSIMLGGAAGEVRFADRDLVGRCVERTGVNRMSCCETRARAPPRADKEREGGEREEGERRAHAELLCSSALLRELS